MEAVSGRKEVHIHIKMDKSGYFQLDRIEGKIDYLIKLITSPDYEDDNEEDEDISDNENLQNDLLKEDKYTKEEDDNRRERQEYSQ